MSKFNKTPIINLKFSDFRSDGSIKHKDFINGVGVIVFYMPNCGYCKMMENDYQKAAVAGARIVPFGAIDGTNAKNKKIVSLASVQSYPTIKIVENGFIDNSYDFKSNRTPENFINFACSAIDEKEKKYKSLCQ